MSQTITKLSQSKVIDGLDTYNHTVVTAGPFVAELNMSCLANSGLHITISQNGSTKLAVGAPSANACRLNARVALNCAASDVIAILVNTTAPAIDNQPAALKGILSIRPGSV